MAKKTSSKSVTTFNSKALDFTKLGDEYGISEDSSIAKAKVSGTSSPRLRAYKDRFEIRQGDKVLDKLKKGESIALVLHASAPAVIQRQYFKGKYIADAPFKPPVCWSDDSETPDLDSPEPMGIPKADLSDVELENASCETCEFGKNGSKACKLTSKIVVAVPVMDDDDKEPMLLDMNLNTGSLISRNESPELGMNFLNYIKFWKKQAKKDPARFITLVSLDMDSPDEWENQMLFKAIEPLPVNGAHWKFNDSLDQDQLRERVRLTYADYDAPTGTSTTGVDPDPDPEAEEEEESKPAAKKKAAAKKKTSSKKKTTSKKKTSSKPKPEPEPDPEEEEEEGEEEEEEEGDEVDLSDPDALDAALSRYQDDDDDDDDDDDEEEEEEDDDDD